MTSFFYKTILAESKGSYKEKGSKFEAYAIEVNTEIEIKKHIQKLKDENPKACHICYAWRMGLDKNNYRANDDGEPSGTAGKPILGQIDSAQLTNVLVAVVRYFGGTKLGVPGLIHAYKAATIDALANAQIVEKELMCIISAEIPHEQVNMLHAAIKKHHLKMLEQSFEAHFSCKLLLPKRLVPELTDLLKNIGTFELLQN